LRPGPHRGAVRDGLAGRARGDDLPLSRHRAPALAHVASNPALFSCVEPLETAVRVTPSARRAEEWATVLAASGIHHRVAPTATGWAVVVAGDDGAKASTAVGASTLTFGAIGVLSAQAFVARWRGRPTRRRPWVVVVAGLMLLLMLGTAQGADVPGHLFGLLAGAVLGLGAGLARPRPFAPPI